MLRIAHVSDLHVMAPNGIEWRRILFNKRVTGAANLLLHRRRAFSREYLRLVLRAASRAADHIVITGDLTNLALESEYVEARHLLDELTSQTELTLAPGNHDLYLPKVAQRQRFFHHFEPYLRSNLPEFAVDLPAGRFPVVKLRDRVAFIALSSAVPRPPFVSAGFLGHAQLTALKAILKHPDVASRTPVVLVHHDPMGTRPRIEQLRSGLIDATAFRDVLAQLPRGLILFGHLHLRRHDRMTTAAGTLDVVCASGASLESPDPRVRAGYNLYRIGNDGDISSIESWVLDPTTGQFSHFEIPCPGCVGDNGASVSGASNGRGPETGRRRRPL